MVMSLITTGLLMLTRLLFIKEKKKKERKEKKMHVPICILQTSPINRKLSRNQSRQVFSPSTVLLSRLRLIHIGSDICHHPPTHTDTWNDFNSIFCMIDIDDEYMYDAFIIMLYMAHMDPWVLTPSPSVGGGGLNFQQKLKVRSIIDHIRKLGALIFPTICM